MVEQGSLSASLSQLYVYGYGCICNWLTLYYFLCFRKRIFNVYWSVIISCSSLYLDILWRKLDGFLHSWHILGSDCYFHSCCILCPAWCFGLWKWYTTSAADGSVISTLGKVVTKFLAFNTSQRKGVYFSTFTVRQPCWWQKKAVIG